MSDRPDLDATADFVKQTMTRAELLELLTDGPSSAQVLADELDTSRSTVHRVTETLGEYELVRRTDGQIAITGLGRTIAEELGHCRGKLNTARRLGPFLNTIDVEAVSIPLDRFEDPTVIAPTQRRAHVGVNRIIELIERTDSLRMFSSIISPLYVNAALREMIDGTRIEVVFDREVVEIIAGEYAEEASEALETGRFHVRVGEAIPFELFLFDDRTGMAAHDESGIARAFVESDSDAVREWAEDLYETYAERADPVELR